MAIRGHDIVCLASQDFDDLWTRKQRWMARLAEHNRVFWVNLQMHAITYLRRFPEMWKRGGSGHLQQVRERLWVYTPPVTIPCFQMSTTLCHIHNVFLNRMLRLQLKRLGFTRNILWLYTPYNAYQIGRLWDNQRIYECVDDFSAARGLVRATVVRQLERDTLSKVDLTIVTSETLAEKFAGTAGRLILSPNAADVEHFGASADTTLPLPDTLRDIAGPVIGFVGSLSYWVDVPLIAELARLRPDWTFVLVGPVRTNVRALARLLNIRILGQQPYATLPGYLRRFDVCLNPYRNHGISDGASPLKLYEYLASGKPIVSSDMPEARQFVPLVAIAGTPAEHKAAIEQALTENGSGRRERQLAVARQHGWPQRFAQLEQELDNVLL